MKHFYFDQGGLLGDATYRVTDRPLEPSDDEGAIVNYYYGHMTPAAIQFQLWAFGRLFPACKCTELQ